MGNIVRATLIHTYSEPQVLWIFNLLGGAILTLSLFWICKMNDTEDIKQSNVYSWFPHVQHKGSKEKWFVCFLIWKASKQVSPFHFQQPEDASTLFEHPPSQTWRVGQRHWARSSPLARLDHRLSLGTRPDSRTKPFWCLQIQQHGLADINVILLSQCVTNIHWYYIVQPQP